MRLSIFKNSKRIQTPIIIVAIITLALLNGSTSANAPIPAIEHVKTMPSEVGSFRLIGDARQLKTDSVAPELRTPSLISTTEARYELADGTSLFVDLLKWESDSAAYSHVANLSQAVHRDMDSSSDRIGTASVRTGSGPVFFKGPASVDITINDQNKIDRAAEFGRLFALTLDSGEGDIPVLVKHLPNWESVQNRVAYAVSSKDLVGAVANQAILKEVSFDGGTEAVIANYGQSQLVIIEFTTPQFSIDNDQRIWTRIAELKAKGEPGPTAYRRVGNYSVFVFNAPDEKTANALVEQVKYEQVVQWLGDDPHLAERLQRYFTQTSAGVLVAVLKSSGLSLVLCLAIGGLIGAMLFRHRRAQKAAAYSDAGGSIRLNLDELTEPVKTGRLLKSAEPPEQPSANS